jgi:hypothetical protein
LAADHGRLPLKTAVVVGIAAFVPLRRIDTLLCPTRAAPIATAASAPADLIHRAIELLAVLDRERVAIVINAEIALFGGFLRTRRTRLVHRTRRGVVNARVKNAPCVSCIADVFVSSIPAVAGILGACVFFSHVSHVVRAPISPVRGVGIRAV